MENLDLVVLRALRDWRQAGRRALLATVVRTWGSSPRPIGSIMALCEDGTVVGSVSGGCIEDDLIYRFTRALSSEGDGHEIPQGAPQLLKYHINAVKAYRFALFCGGPSQLLLEFDPQPETSGELVNQIQIRPLIQREIILADGKVTLHAAEQ